MSCKYCEADALEPCKQCGAVLADEIKDLRSRLDSVTRERDDAVAAMSRHANRVLTQQRDEARSRLDKCVPLLRELAARANSRGDDRLWCEAHNLADEISGKVVETPEQTYKCACELCPGHRMVPAVERKCGQPVANIGGAENMVWICTLPEGHRGNCFNEYVGENVVERPCNNPIEDTQGYQNCATCGRPMADHQ